MTSSRAGASNVDAVVQQQVGPQILRQPDQRRDRVPGPHRVAPALSLDDAAGHREAKQREILSVDVDAD